MVLMYHHVLPGHSRLSVKTASFERQIAWLARAGYVSLTARQFADYLDGAPVPEKSVLITFDDGYLDNWVYAHPVLQRHGMHAVMFLITGWIGDGPARPHAGQGVALAGMPDHEACRRLYEQGRHDEVIVRWSEVRAMLEAGTFEVHSHTHTHTRWDLRCGSDAAAKREAVARELADSRAALECHAGGAGNHLCWPQGYFDADYVEAARAAGFRNLYTTDDLGQNRPGGDPGYIYRIAVRNSDSVCRNLRFKLRLWVARNLALGPRYQAWKRDRKARRAAGRG
jgi:peptidoglycan/xylan/chitin deacetylase (PgdA/CDA1 family)